MEKAFEFLEGMEGLIALLIWRNLPYVLLIHQVDTLFDDGDVRYPKKN